MHLSMLTPRGGGSGKGWGFDQSGGPMGRDLDWHFFSKWPEGGDFWKINTDLRRYTEETWANFRKNSDSSPVTRVVAVNV
jgi:hypothetical protein